MDKPIYQQVKETIFNEIKKQAANTPILSEREWADLTGISRMTIRKAIRKLVEEGYLYRDKNKGTFVADQKMHKRNSMKQLFYLQDEDVSYKILHFAVKQHDKEISMRLEMEEEDYFVKIIRQINRGYDALCIDEIYIVRQMVRHLDPGEMDVLLDFQMYLENGIVSQTFIPMAVPVQYAKLLDLKMQTSIILVESVICNNHGRVYAFIRTYMNPKRTQISFTL